MFYKATESMYKRGVHYVQIPLERDIDLFLWNSLANALESFCDRWSRHLLNNPCGPQCSKVIVLDGHQKCTRRLCQFEDEYMESTELGRIPVLLSQFFYCTMLYFKVYAYIGIV
ncbi:unnamed protein product [Didymodactylos carnosus]|uniref:Uncharacterized protein n=2 Tax=Didymodactylos carnosus TaxID=1234261 RepID=A0A815UW37_9BILA|nr:unnamed protein product [Didymodactylos carnosus]CAF4383421.1 unnamed protein product [Didymodactylos carnosus]